LYKILLVEDEDSLMDVLSLNLSLEGYHIDKAVTGNEAKSLINKDYDLFILDVMLPEINGFDLCELIRENHDTPILFISAKGTSTDKIKGLSIGADDYLVKPFHLDEFLLRVNILLTRRSPSTSNKNTEAYLFGKNFTINFKTFEVYSNLGQSTFSKREIELLKILTNKQNQVVSREEILNSLWPETSSPNSRTIDNYILNFRKHFEETPKQPRHFISLRGIGYKFIK
jgi:two-component system alkaline phosphatase synthesis response regulator PhoP